MPQFATRPWITAGAALAGAGIVAVTPVAAPLPNISAPDIRLISDQVDMVLDLVRHGQSLDNVDGTIGTTPPGVGLTNTGYDQADAVGQAIAGQYGSSIDGIFASEFIRAQQTAAPLADLLGMNVQNLAGLNEINAGILDGVQQNELAGLLYAAPALAWMFGQYWVPMVGSDIDPNGMAFQDRFSDAVQTIYNSGGTLTDGHLTDVAYSHGAAITAWAMMNVKNPDFDLIFKQMLETQGGLPNTGQVVLEGNPTDGWTMVSWDGTPVPQDPGLGTALFVDFRDLITAPQMATWHIWEAILGGDSTMIMTAVQTGFNEVAAALVQFPESVFNDIVDALDDGGALTGAFTSI